MKRFFPYIFFVLSFAIALLHFKYAIKALFVFRNAETVFVWLTILAGPLSTLPVVICSIVAPRIGAMWLVCGSAVSSISFAASSDAGHGLVDIYTYLISYTMPALLIGFTTLSRRTLSTHKTKTGG